MPVPFRQARELVRIVRHRSAQRKTCLPIDGKRVPPVGSAPVESIARKLTPQTGNRVN